MMQPDAVEPIIDPDLPIVDAHHHLWYLPEAMLAQLQQQDSIANHALAPTMRRFRRYLFDEFMADLGSGHNIRGTIMVDAHAMYRSQGPESLRSVGEVEFATGIAAMGNSGLFGDIKVCAGIVGGIDLRLGDEVVDILNAQVQAGGRRYCGIRSRPIAYDEDETILGRGASVPHVLLDPSFRRGFQCLRPLGLSCDVFLLEPQLPELIDLAKAFPETQIILNHMGTPLGVGRYAGQLEERFARWRKHMVALAKSPNVAVKLGGLGLPFAGFPLPATSEQLATRWRPWVEVCIEAFGVNRCMFASNFPLDGAACSYAVLWNACKRLAQGASIHEKAALFSGTAQRIYRLDI